MPKLGPIGPVLRAVPAPETVPVGTVFKVPVGLLKVCLSDRELAAVLDGKGPAYQAGPVLREVRDNIIWQPTPQTPVRPSHLSNSVRENV
jgi:hypothetical protein